MKSTNKKNLVFIMCDQLRYDAIGANGNTSVITPNLDSLCNDSTGFTSYFTNAPVCVPSRCSLFTGRYTHSHLCRENHTLLESGREIHLFRAMKHEGYKIGYFGKNHFLHPSEFNNFDYSFTEGITPFSDSEKECTKSIREVVAAAGSVAHKTATYHNHDKELTNAAKWTNYAVQSIKEAALGAQPFCFCLSIVEPHYPHVAPKEIWDMYEGHIFDLPDIHPNDIPSKPPRYSVKQKAQHSAEADYAEKQAYLRAYYSLVTLMDLQVGKVINCLKEQGLYEDTAIIFTSDHGDFCFNHGMTKKDLVLQDDLLHVPLIVKFPETCNKGKIINDTLAEEVDVLPTILDYIGGSIPRGCQGKSLLPLLKEETHCHKDEVFAEVNPPWLKNKFDSYEDYCEYCKQQGQTPSFNIPGDYCKSIRTADYKYIWFARGWNELYNISEDPGETKNLANDDTYSDVLTNLKMKLLEWNAISEEPLDIALVKRLHKKYPDWQTDPDSIPEWLPYWAEEDY